MSGPVPGNCSYKVWKSFTLRYDGGGAVAPLKIGEHIWTRSARMVYDMEGNIGCMPHDTLYMIREGFIKLTNEWISPGEARRQLNQSMFGDALARLK